VNQEIKQPWGEGSRAGSKRKPVDKRETLGKVEQKTDLIQGGTHEDDQNGKAGHRLLPREENGKKPKKTPNPYQKKDWL
jgi:hypothetical protein